MVRIVFSESTVRSETFQTNSGASSLTVASSGVVALPPRPVMAYLSHSSQVSTSLLWLSCQVTLPKPRGSFSVWLGPPLLEFEERYWPERKNQSLSLAIGPPSWRVESVALLMVGFKPGMSALFEVSEWLVNRVATSPFILLPPDWVTLLKTTPVKPPYSAGAPRPTSWTSL